MSKKIIPESDEFFVGYLPEAPVKTMTFLKRVALLVGMGIVTIGVLLVLNEREFSSSKFEYGKYTALEGFVFKSPIPHIRIAAESDSLGNTNYKTLLLVGSGKMGADKALSTFEETLGELEGKFVRMEGELIYGNSKSLFQISASRLPVVKKFSGGAPLVIEKLGVASLQGEIVDPKCYFGVMKPGEGKPHRSCAIRCISGGIPPVFHSTAVSDYFILLDENFQTVNDQVLDMVGDRVTLTGETYLLDDWKILLVRKENLKKQALSTRVLRNLVAMEKGMTMCGVN